MAYPLKTQKDLHIFHEKIMESVFVKISAKNGKKIIVGSLYHPPNNLPSEFTTKLNELTSKVKLEKKQRTHSRNEPQLRSERLINQLKCFVRIYLIRTYCPQ